MKTEHDRRAAAIVDCMLAGADEIEVYRLASINGWDTATIRAGIDAFRRCSLDDVPPVSTASPSEAFEGRRQ